MYAHVSWSEWDDFPPGCFYTPEGNKYGGHRIFQSPRSSTTVPCSNAYPCLCGAIIPTTTAATTAATATVAAGGCPQSRGASNCSISNCDFSTRSPSKTCSNNFLPHHDVSHWDLDTTGYSDGGLSQIRCTSPKGSEATWDSNVGHNAKGSVLLKGSPSGQVFYSSPCVQVSPSQPYTVSAWFKTASGTVTCNMELRQYKSGDCAGGRNPAGTYGTGWGVVAGAGAWAEFNFPTPESFKAGQVIKLAAWASDVRVRLNCVGEGGFAVYADDVHLDEVCTTSSTSTTSSEQPSTSSEQLAP